MKIASLAAGLALVTGLAAAVPADAQRFHDRGYGHERIEHGRGYGGHPAFRGPRYAYRGAHGYHGRVVCTYRHGARHCFRRF